MAPQDVPPLFNERFYLWAYPETKEFGHPVEHWLTKGIAAGCKPNALFEPLYYASQAPDMADSGLDPLTHWVREGEARGLRPNPFFDPIHYRLQVPGLAENSLAHYLREGLSQGVETCDRAELVLASRERFSLWIEANSAPRPLEQLRDSVLAASGLTAFRLVMEFGSDAVQAAKTVESLKRQILPFWNLDLVGDVPKGFLDLDRRLRIMSGWDLGGTSDEYVGTVRPGDEFLPGALAACALSMGGDRPAFVFGHSHHPLPDGGREPVFRPSLAGCFTRPSDQFGPLVMVRADRSPIASGGDGWRTAVYEWCACHSAEGLRIPSMLLASAEGLPEMANWAKPVFHLRPDVRVGRGADEDCDVVALLVEDAVPTSPLWAAVADRLLDLPGVGAVAFPLTELSETVHPPVPMVAAFGGQRDGDHSERRTVDLLNLPIPVAPGLAAGLCLRPATMKTLTARLSAGGSELLDMELMRLLSEDNLQVVAVANQVKAGPPSCKRIEAAMLAGTGSVTRVPPVDSAVIDPGARLRIVPKVPASVRKPIRTMAFTHNLNLEGAPQSQFEVVTGLKRRGAIDPVVHSPTDGPLRNHYEREGIQVVLAGKSWHAGSREDVDRAMQGVTGLMLSQGAELIYANTLLTYFAISAAARAHLPSVWNIRESEAPETHLALAGSPVLEEGLACLRYPYRVVFVSEATRRAYGPFAAAGNFICIPNGIDHDRLQRRVAEVPRVDARRLLGLDVDDLMVLSVGTTCQRKGQADLLQACQMLPAFSAGKVRIFMVGDRDSPYSAMIHRMREELPPALAERVHLVAETDHVGTYFRAADVFAFCSRVESYPRVILEALAFGLPIVTTPVFGVREQTLDGVSALYYEPGDAQGLARHLDALVQGPALRAELARNADLTSRSLIDYAGMLDGYAQVFREAWSLGRPLVQRPSP